MNSMLKTSAAIGAFVAAGIFSSSASAQSTKDLLIGCLTPGLCAAAKGTEYQGPSGTFTSMDYLSFPGIAATGPAPKPATHDDDSDPTTPEVPLLVDHDSDPTTAPVQAYVPQAPTAGINARVHGSESVAVGSGSRVGAFVYDSVTGEQVFIDSSNYSGTCITNGSDAFCRDLEGNKIPATTAVNNGTAIGANSQVSHNGSTAVGAGAKTTQENQVMIGKEGDRITAPGVKQAITKPMHGIVVVDQDGNLGSDGGALHGRVGSLENTMTSMGGTINAHSALLSDHSKRLDSVEKGLAIAMSMPDSWLSDKKRFGIFGAVGGFGDETALGFAAIGRIDETFSLNAKFGGDTEFKEFGWQVGVGAQW